MIKNLNQIVACLLIASITMITGCKKQEVLTTPLEQAHFTNRASGTYDITGPTVTYKIPVGVTTVSTTDRTVNISVTSPTGAQLGTHYTLSKTSAVIPAGKSLDSIEVRAVFAQYQAGRKDTLVFTINEGGVTRSDYNPTFKLLMRGPCFEGDVNLNLFLGAYTRTNETFGTSPYGPYRTTVSAVTQLTPTTGRVTITNVYDDGWVPAIFTFDWTDPANRKITLLTQNVGGNSANTFGATYAGMPYGIQPVPTASGGQVGTFSVCNQTITLRMQVGIFGVGYSANLYTVTMVR